MGEKKRSIRIGATAFLLTVVLLAAILCGVRIDCVAQNTLHGATTTTILRGKTVENVPWLPPSINALIRILQVERDAVASLLHKITTRQEHPVGSFDVFYIIRRISIL